VLFVGDDWAEDHHDIEVQDEKGRVLARARLPEGIAGITRLHALIGQFADLDAEPDEVAIGIETDRGPWVAALAAAGYTVYAVNPLQASRYRERHGVSGAKSDTGAITPQPGTLRLPHHIEALTVEVDLTGVRGEDARKAVEQRRLARAARAHHGDDLATLDGETRAAKRGGLPEEEHEVSRLDDHASDLDR
jgi:hypothetical protein